MWKLIFEGEYLNGERNGKGIEYVFKVEYFTDEGKDEKLLFEPNPQSPIPNPQSPIPMIII